MNILMMTNTYLPHVGGVARSVDWFTREFREMGHRVVVVAPEFVSMPVNEKDVVRIPAIQNFNGSDFSVVVPIPGFLRRHLDTFSPDIVHSHHPFLVGSTAVRIASQREIPLVFTYHTNYEQYTHYVPGDSPRMKKFAIQLAKGYCNIADHVVTPSESIEKILRERGVKTPITSIPTGIRVKDFSSGDRSGFRKRFNIPENNFLAGHLGRLAPEKNLEFLARSVREFIKKVPESSFLVVGSGPSEKSIKKIFSEEGLADRLYMAGKLDGQDLVDAYHAMDIFTFASKSETQGMVIAEAMAASLPVIALDAPGIREVVKDGENGRLLYDVSVESFSSAIENIYSLSKKDFDLMKEKSFSTADSLDLSKCVNRLMDLYTNVCRDHGDYKISQVGFWETAMDQLKVEWDLVRNVAEAAASSFKEEKQGK